MIRFEEIKDKETWNNAVYQFGGLFTQSFEYGEWQKGLGRSVVRSFIFDDKKLVGVLFLVFFPLFKNRTYGYSPFGPLCHDYALFEQKEVLNFLREVGKHYKAVFIRLESTNKINFFKEAHKDSYKGSHFQLRNDFILDVRKSVEIILGSFDQNARYCIQKAQNNGLNISVVDGKNLPAQETILSLLKETAKRNNFSLHEDEYYEQIFSSLSPENSFFVFAKKDDRFVAGALCFVIGNEVMYLLGGSTTEDRKLFGSYLVQFEAIKETKIRGKWIYNFGAITDQNGKPESLKGVTQFKKKFGGEVRTYGKFFDLVLDNSWYTVYILRKRFVK